MLMMLFHRLPREKNVAPSMTLKLLEYFRQIGPWRVFLHFYWFARQISVTFHRKLREEEKRRIILNWNSYAMLNTQHNLISVDPIKELVKWIMGFLYPLSELVESTKNFYLHSSDLSSIERHCCCKNIVNSFKGKCFPLGELGA